MHVCFVSILCEIHTFDKLVLYNGVTSNVYVISVDVTCSPCVYVFVFLYLCRVGFFGWIDYDTWMSILVLMLGWLTCFCSGSI